MSQGPCPNCGRISCNWADCYYDDDPAESEFVTVRRDDLRLALVWSTTADNHMNKSPWHVRLKAALEKTP